MRFGLHSGPCTAGVLKGKNARFQLFGDTINMAARMENSSIPNRVHISKATADLLVEAGFSQMVTRRDERVHLKGKGIVDSFFLVPAKKHSVNSSISSGRRLMNDGSRREATKKTKEAAKKTKRLIDWNVKILSDQVCVLAPLGMTLMYDPLVSMKRNPLTACFFLSLSLRCSAKEGCGKTQCGERKTQRRCCRYCL